MLAAIHFGIRAPGLFGIAASLFDDIRGVKPSLEMAAAEFSLGVFFIAGALPRLLEFHFVVRKLRGSDCGRGQR